MTPLENARHLASQKNSQVYQFLTSYIVPTSAGYALFSQDGEYKFISNEDEESGSIRRGLRPIA